MESSIARGRPADGGWAESLDPSGAREPDPPAAPGAWRTVVAAVVFGLAAVAVQLPYALTNGMDWDETLSVHTTFRMMREGRWLPYQSGQNYMGTLQELLDAASMSVFGRSLIAFRLPTLVLTALSAGLAYVLTSRVAGRGHAVAVGLLMVCMNSTFGHFGYRSQPEYPLALFLSLALVGLALRCDARRTPARWAGLGVVGGLALYTFGITAIQLAVCLGWLFARSDYGRRWLGALSGAGPRAGGWLALALAAGSALSATPVLYRYLTRVQTFSPGPVDLALGAAAGILFAGAVIAAYRVVAPARRELLAAACVLTPALALPAAAGYWHRLFVQPELVEAGVTPWAAGSYTLRHVHEWPGQFNLLFGYIIPDAAAGRRTEFALVEAADVSLRPVGVLALVLTAGAVLVLVKPLATMTRSGGAAVWLLVAPPLLMTAAMFPSWRLNGDQSVRYYYVCAPGLFLLGSALVTRLCRWRGVAAGVLVGYAAYSLADFATNSPGYDPATPAEQVYRVANREGAGAILAGGELGKELIWVTRGHVVVADPFRPRVNWWYVRRGEIASFDCVVTAGLDEAGFRAALGPGADAYTLSATYPDKVSVYRKAR